MLADLPTKDLITWRDDFSVRHAEMDKDHQRLIYIINCLHAALEQRKGSHRLHEILEVLFHYSESHFHSEEELMENVRFPGLGEHRATHDKFRATVRDMKARMDHGDRYVATDLMHFLKNWLVDHILKHDKEYARYMG